MTLYPVQEYVGGEIQYFKCSCGKTKFTEEESYDEHDYSFNCLCGKKYRFSYGNVYKDGANND